MTDNQTSDDVYDDPDNSLTNSDDVNGATELPLGEQSDLSQSIYKPELGNDDRGRIEELETADGGEDHDEMATQYPEDSDSDSNHLSDMDPSDERDGTEA